jgi:hypothetical protein
MIVKESDRASSAEIARYRGFAIFFGLVFIFYIHIHIGMRLFTSDSLFAACALGMFAAQNTALAILKVSINSLPALLVSALSYTAVTVVFTVGILFLRVWPPHGWTIFFLVVFYGVSISSRMTVRSAKRASQSSG